MWFRKYLWLIKQIKIKLKINRIIFQAGLLVYLLGGEGSVLSDLIVLYCTNYMLHDQFDTQNHDIRQTFVQPSEQVFELGQGAAAVFLQLRSGILERPCFSLGMSVWVTLETCPGVPGTRVFSGFSHRRVQLDANIALMARALSWQPRCVGALRRGRVVPAPLDVVEMAVAWLHGGIFFLVQILATVSPMGYHKSQLDEKYN